jgi:cytochrome o ubiquinol oxidase subunit I
MLGKLTLSAIPFQNPIVMGAVAFMVLAVVGVLGTITALGKWKYLWTEWLTSVDHKKIGAMYIILAGVMLLRGFADAVMMRAQQALAYGPNAGYLPPEHFDQVFSAHGTIMIFFMAMPFMIGLMNCVLPLQIGARDVAFPFLNSLSLWLTVVGAMLVNLSLAIGSFARTGWLAYPPLSELHFSPGVGVDYYIWALQISGIGTTLTGVNFIATILKMRAPGMTLMRMPVFTWTALCTNILIVAAFPVLTVSLALLTLDRYLGMHFFTNSLGGDPMMYINLIWIWGHPEVYILVLPAFGIFSEIIATFSGKRLFGYTSMVFATMAIALLSFVVWLHHFFTMGSGADVNAFFGITTMVIAVPTGVKIFNWLFTMYRGRVRFESPVLWTIGFMITFVIGGMSGVLQQRLPGGAFSQRHHRRGGVRRHGRAHLLVPEGIRLPSQRDARQGGVLVLARRVLRGLHAALRSWAHGGDAPHGSLRQSGLAAAVRRRGDRCGHHLLRHHAAARTGGGQPRPARTGARPERRSVGRPHAGVGDILAAAGI